MLGREIKMNLGNRIIWQQAAGDTDRNFAQLCLKWDVILNGPGYAGPWPECREKLRSDKLAPRKCTDLSRFCEEMKDGDLVVLRLGTSKVLGVGEVVGDYEWMDLFGDVDGWDLQHVRRVRWLWTSANDPKEFPVYSMKLGDPTQRLDSKNVRTWMASLDISPIEQARELVNIPLVERGEVALADVSDFLFDQGVASASIESLLQEIGELERIARWYQKFGNPSESETVAYLVVPLLRALGWTPQKMAIEWNYVDVALFSTLPREDVNLSVVVEAKKKGSSCLSALSQARDYAQARGGCQRLIVTDGIRFGIYIRVQDEFALHAYMNLTDLKDNYTIYGCHGTKMALLAMTPEWKRSAE
jgi:hypothetical protein